MPSSRFDLHKLGRLDDPGHMTILPFPQEWQLECPGLNKLEDITIFGTNTSGELLYLHILWSPSSDQKQARARVHLIVNLSPEESVSLLEDHSVDLSALLDCRGRVTTLQLGSLNLEFVFPFRTIRLVFLGLLRNDQTKAFHNVNLRAFWLCLGKVFDSKSDFNAKWREEQTKSRKVEPEDRFEQWGEIKACIQIDDGKQQNHFFWGIKSKAYDLVERIEQGVTYRRLVAWSQKGFGIHVGVAKDASMAYLYGHVNLGVGLVTSVERIDLSIEQFERVTAGKGDQPSKSMWVDCPQEHRSFQLQLFKPFKSITPDDFMLQCSLTIDDQKGIGLVWNESSDYLIAAKAWLDSKPPELIHSPLTQTDSSLLVCALSQPCCALSSLTGGKASSLAQLYQLSASTTSPLAFSVPNAVVLTVHAFKAFLAANPWLEEPIKLLEKSVRGDHDSLEAQCSELIKLIESASLSADLITIIAQALEQNFGENYRALSFAVRSSACGEDSTDMSAAGQMKTCLGVLGEERELAASIVSCWASQFSKRAMLYKNSYGQPLVSRMGVIMQEMVASSVAGVTFTCDPLTGDQRYMSLAASYGLGESVVSASVEPDSIRLEIEADHTSLSVARRVKHVNRVTIGAKKKGLFLEDANIVQKSIDEDKQTKCCLEETTMVALGGVCLVIQQHYGSVRDIEWGVDAEGSIWVFQSRPITTLLQYNDWELMHELDVGHNSEREGYSRSNVGEVFPGACSYTIVWLLNIWKQHTFNFWLHMSSNEKCDFVPYYNTVFGLLHNTVFFNLKTGAPPFDGETDSIMSKSALLSLFGRLDVEDELLHDSAAKKRCKPIPLMRKFNSAFHLLAPVFTAAKTTAKTKSYMDNLKLEKDVSQMDANELFHVLSHRGDILALPIFAHFNASFCSMICNTSLFGFIHANMLQLTGCMIHCETQFHNILCSKLTEPERIDYFTQLISSVSNVFSAQVPVLLESVADKLLGDNQFLLMTDDEALELLKSGTNEASKAYLAFLAEYGHRGYKEFDPAARPWREDGRDLVRSIRAIIKNKHMKGLLDWERAIDYSLTLLCYTKAQKQKEKEQGDNGDKTPAHVSLPWHKRLLFSRLLLPLTRRGITIRELSKNEFIRAVDFFRTVYHQLAARLVDMLRLPQAELIFYLTFPELQLLVEHAHASIVARATARQRLQPRKEALIFHETIYGPEMLPRNAQTGDDDVPDHKHHKVELHGLAVSSGRVTGRACVALSLEQAGDLRPGDILITFSTDIGWSPYFVTLAGLVSEVGGLVSHGAVIAREYQLPALVGVRNATQTFATGDHVLLDTAAGIIVRLEGQD